MFIGQGSTLNDGSVEATAHMCWVWSHSPSCELMGSIRTAPLQTNTRNEYEEMLAHMLFLRTTKIIDKKKINICLLCSVQTALTSLPLSGGAETVARQDCQSDTCRVAVTVVALETHRLSLITQSDEQPDSQSVHQSVSHL